MKKILAVLISLLFVGSAFGIVSLFGATGGPDEFGYTYDDAVPYQWIDISETGIDTGLKDYGGTTIPMGFNFNFYGNTYDEIYISTSGFLQFGGQGNNPSGSDYENQDMPIDDNLDNIICPFWDDLILENDEREIGRIYYQSFPDKFIIQWNEVMHSNDQYTTVGGFPSTIYQGSKFTFQVIFFKDSNAIKFQYKEMVDSRYLYADGRSATIGIENIDGTIGLKYFFGEYNESSNPGAPLGPIRNGLAIGFKYPGRKAPWDTGQLPMAQILKILKANKDKE